MKYIFWEQYNCQKISGLPKLIIMGIKALGLTNNVALISQETSLVYITLKEEKIPFEFIEENTINSTSQIRKADVLILPTLNTKTFILHKYNPKVIIWQIYPSLCVNSCVNKRIVKFQMRKVIRSNAFISMDKICYDTFYKEIGLYPNQIIPMPIDHMKYQYKSDKSSFPKCSFNISYLGRAQDWKIYAVIRMLIDMCGLKDYSFHLHIFTDSQIVFKRMICKYIGPNTHVSFYEGYHGQRLLDMLSTMDIHYAMGISTLEGAALGIPTLIAPLSYGYVPNGFKYNWLYQDVEHYAGVILSDNCPNGHSTFEEVIKMVSVHKSALEISELCFQAVSGFSLEAIGESLQKVDTKLTLRDCHYRMISYWKNKMFLRSGK